jgi:hypothetical protein
MNVPATWNAFRGSRFEPVAGNVHTGMSAIHAQAKTR